MFCHILHHTYMQSDFRHGFTLVETLIFIALLSMMIFSFLRYLYSLNDSSMRLYDDISNAYTE